MSTPDDDPRPRPGLDPPTPAESDALKASLEDMRAGRVSPAEEMLDEMRRILDAKRRGDPPGA